MIEFGLISAMIGWDGEVVLDSLIRVGEMNQNGFRRCSAEHNGRRGIPDFGGVKRWLCSKVPLAPIIAVEVLVSLHYVCMCL